jgi:hypothetical protein
MCSASLISFNSHGRNPFLVSNSPQPNSISYDRLKMLSAFSLTVAWHCCQKTNQTRRHIPMNKLLLVVVLMLGTSICFTGCTGNSPTADKAKQEGKETSEGKKEKEQPDKVLVFAELASNPKVAFKDRKEAVELLGRMGSKAKNAVPNLIKAFEDDKSDQFKPFVAKTLSQIGTDAKDAVPALVKHSQSWKPSLNNDTVESAHDLAGKLADGMAWDNRGLSFLSTAEALWRIDQKVELSILIGAIRHGSPKDKVTALKLLGEIGPRAKTAVPIISSCKHSASYEVRDAAEDALKKIAPSGTTKDK